MGLLWSLEPQETANTFKIFALDKAQDWLDRERARSVDVPDDGSLGVITVHSAQHFEFGGPGRSPARIYLLLPPRLCYTRSLTGRLIKRL